MKKLLKKSIIITLSLCIIILFTISCIAQVEKSKTDAKDGINGESGNDGADGKDGLDGKDGQNATSLNVSGTIAPGEYLSLQHNLGRDDLTFTGQFTKNGYIYDYSQYTYLFSNIKKNEIKPPTVFEDAGTSYNSITTLKNGNFVIAYSMNDNFGNGLFIIYNPDGTLNLEPIEFNSSYTNSISITTLNNDNFVIAYNDLENDDSENGKFIIYNEQGTIVSGPIVFEKGGISPLSITTLKNGKFVIAYRQNTGNGAFVIYNEDGTLDSSSTTFDINTIDSIATTPLNNGNFVIAYSIDDDFNYGYFIIYKEDGTTDYKPILFERGSSNYISTTTLKNGSFVIAYQDAGNDNVGTFVIYNENGTGILAPTIFNYNTTNFICVKDLNNGDFLISYIEWNEPMYGTFIIYDKNGNIDSDPINFITTLNLLSYLTCTTLLNNDIVFTYTEQGDDSNSLFCIYGEYSLDLKIVNNNEVQLWNHTNETLDLRLSVDQ